MFQRIKGAIDQTIAQEQARQRLPQTSDSRSGSRSHRATSRNQSPGRRLKLQTARGRPEDDVGNSNPDPSAFEPEFVIEDDIPSRTGTPLSAGGPGRSPAKDNASQPTVAGDSPKGNPGKSPGEPPDRSHELPAEVRVKLRKLDKLEARYQELLRSYRVAHGRVQSIETFESCLRENTPLTSISDPSAFAEYLNQVNLKGDMVLDELKRVSSERDDFKKRLGAAEQSTREAWDEVGRVRKGEKSRDGGNPTLDSGTNSEADGANQDDGMASTLAKIDPSAAVQSPKSAEHKISSHQPGSVPQEAPHQQRTSEDLFSYDEEIPRLESELNAKQEKINHLDQQVKSLGEDLAITRESTQSMVQTLEVTTREVISLRDGKDRLEAELSEQKDSASNVSVQLHEKLRGAEAQLQVLQAEHSAFDVHRPEILEKELHEAQEALKAAQQSAKTANIEVHNAQDLQKTIDSLTSELAEIKVRNADLASHLERTTKLLEESQRPAGNSSSKSKTTISLGAVAEPNFRPTVAAGEDSQTLLSGSIGTEDASTSGKKKNKKKKKGGKAHVEHAQSNPSETKNDIPQTSSDDKTIGIPQDANHPEVLKDEIDQLRTIVKEREAAIDRLTNGLKDQDGLREEIETLRDDLLHVGEEHVSTKDQAKTLLLEKVALEKRITEQEGEIAQLQSQLSSTGDSTAKYDDLTTQFEALKSKASILQSDLSAAQQLASARFKDLNELRSSLQKAQPEINKLRSEAAELASIKEVLAKREAEFKRLDARHEDMRSDVIGLKQVIGSKESESRVLSQRLKEESMNRSRAEDASSKSMEELQRTQTEAHQATNSLDRLSKELAQSREELLSIRAKFREIEQQLQSNRSESAGLHEDIELKSAQYASAQSLMASMRDQTSEMATQMKEAKERCESLDDELAEAHRLLSERSREGETMRRLLAEVEGRADSRIREMKERMDTAMEERDRTEDEASTAGRRRARELEELRNRFRDVERSLKRAEDDKEELESSQRDWKRRREELEQRATQSHDTAEEARRAMRELRDALDESEKQAREQEKQKAEMRRSTEETQHKLERLQKSNKVMADEISKLQSIQVKSKDADAQSRQPSAESVARLSSPTPKPTKPSTGIADLPHGQRPVVNGQNVGSVDYVYLKNVLLQFLEHKDKKLQVQLIPVLGMLLHFDRSEEQKWMSVINTKA